MQTSSLFEGHENEINRVIRDSIKSARLFREILSRFSLKKFSCPPGIIATIDTDKYSLDEFLAMSGEFEMISFTRNGRYERWLRCTKNGFGLNYENHNSKGKGLERQYDHLYWKWDEEYFRYFKAQGYAARLAILQVV